MKVVITCSPVWSQKARSAGAASWRTTPLPASTTGRLAPMMISAARSRLTGSASIIASGPCGSGAPVAAVPMMSSGSSRWVAPGFSAAAMLNALRTASGTMRGWWMRVFHLVMGRSISTVSMNWCVVSLCMPARPVWPVSATSGAWSSVASPTPVARLLAPGPRVARHTPGLPVSRP